MALLSKLQELAVVRFRKFVESGIHLQQATAAVFIKGLVIDCLTNISLPQ